MNLGIWLKTYEDQIPKWLWVFVFSSEMLMLTPSCMAWIRQIRAESGTVHENSGGFLCILIAFMTKQCIPLCFYLGCWGTRQLVKCSGSNTVWLLGADCLLFGHLKPLKVSQLKIAEQPWLFRSWWWLSFFCVTIATLWGLSKLMIFIYLKQPASTCWVLFEEKSQ